MRSLLANLMDQKSNMIVISINGKNAFRYQSENNQMAKEYLITQLSSTEYSPRKVKGQCNYNYDNLV